MRNLVVSAASVRPAAELPENVAHCAWDFETGAVYICTSTGAISFVPPGASEEGWQLDLAIEAPPDAPQGDAAAITAFVLVPEAGALCISDASGRLLMIDVETRTIEEVGYLDGGVAALRWAPDGEALCIVTSRGQMLLMTKEWDVLGEVSLLVEAADTPAAADGAEVSAAISLGAAQVAICWRGDCKYVATLVQHGGTAAAAPGDSGQQTQQPQQQQPRPGAAATGPAAAAAQPGEAAATMLKIWLRDGCRLHAIGEAAAGLLPVGAWQPNGRHLYVAQQAPAGPRVLLFETNGLQHGGFDLGPTGSVAQMEWSVDSEMLAIVVAQNAATSGGDGGSVGGNSMAAGGSMQRQQWVQIWRRSNWHWYLKREARHDAGQGRIIIAWDETVAARLHTCSAAGRLCASCFLQQHAVSERGTAAVVDGRRLLLTPLQHELVPPPMASVVAECSAPAQSVSFRTSADGREHLAALLSDGSIAVFAAPEEDFWGEDDGGAAAVEADDGADAETAVQPLQCIRPATGVHAARQLVWLNDGHVLLVAQSVPGQEDAAQQDSCDRLQVVDLATGNIESDCELPSGQHVLCVLPTGGPGADAPAALPPVVQLQDGSVFEFRDGGLVAAPSSSLTARCPLIARIPADSSGPGAPLVVGLSEAGKLWWGPHAIPTATAVTSFAVRTHGPAGAFLLWTERSGLLHSVPLAQLQGREPLRPLQGGAQPPRHRGGRQDAMHQAMHAAMRPASADAPSMAITERAYEQGGLLVTAPPDAAQAVLQMPRGNLEAVAPRVLVLAHIADRLQEGDYAAAWESAITSRVDLNCLVDFAWPAFLSAAGAFVAAVANDSDIADLIAALKPGSVVAADGLYAGMADILPEVSGQPQAASGVADSPADGDASLENKVPRVCEALRDAMSKADAQRYFKAILTSLSKVGRLPDALRLVKDLKEAELAAEEGRMNDAATANGTGGRNNGAAAPSAEDGLKHLMLFTDVETLYRAALGAYELGLAYMVIAASQRDPGEYMLQLQGFALAGPPELQRHAVDMHLGRFGRALQHLMALQPLHFDDALALARDKGLLRDLLALCKGDDAQRAAVLSALGESLSLRNMHEDAGVAFAAAGKLESALKCYRAAGAWQMALALAGRLGWDADSQKGLAADMADELGATGRPADAAVLLADYLGDVEGAVGRLLQAQAWREALRTAYRFARGDLVDAAIAPAAVEAADLLAEATAANTERVAKYLTRYQEVQARRTTMEAALDNGGRGNMAEAGRDTDSGSEAESSAAVSDLSAYASGSGTTATESASGIPASTIGGRKAARKSRQKARKGARIRKGGPGEELALAEHLAGLAPTPQRLLDAGSLAEVLVLLGREDLAATLQQALSQLQADQQAAADYVKQHPPARAEEAEAHAAKTAAPPASDEVRWKWDMLRPVAVDAVP